MIEQIPHHHEGDWPLTPEARRAAMAPRRSLPQDPDATLAAASA
jgi:nitrogenase molybdenum-iron protein NifN